MTTSAARDTTTGAEPADTRAPAPDHADPESAARDTTTGAEPADTRAGAPDHADPERDGRAPARPEADDTRQDGTDTVAPDTAEHGPGIDTAAPEIAEGAPDADTMGPGTAEDGPDADTAGPDTVQDGGGTRPVAERPATSRSAERAMVVELHDPAAPDVELTGAKAAALARAATAGLMTLPGVVLTTAFSDAVDAGEAVAGHPAVRDAYRRAWGAEQSLVVRSSSVAEDGSESSMAGQFESVVGVRGLDGFEAAVARVLDSRERAGATDRPIAVLVQPLMEPVFGGVMFGVDPVTGRSDRRVVTAVRGGPEPLVSGEVDGSRYLLTTDGSVLEYHPGDGASLERAHLKALVALSGRVARTFGGPQDVEWAITRDDRLWLFQSRPVTTEVRGVPRGPVYGPGPVAETFPEPLTELECDLWVPPLREAVREAVLLAGQATEKDVAASDVVVHIEGHVAIDLELAGEIPPRRRPGHRLNPVPAMRKLRHAWQVGRLRHALPGLSEHLLDRVDRDLERVPALAEMTSRQLIAVMHRSRVILRALHAHEILMGMLTDTGRNRMTGASVALRVLTEARQDGLTDREILGRSPVVLALAPPRVAAAPEFPAEATSVNIGPDHANGNDNGILREALRLRVRWVQELSGRAAWALGERLAATDGLPRPGLIRHMSLEHVEAVFTKRAEVVPALVAGHRHDFGTPLPAWFRVSDLGKPIRVQCTDEVGGGTGAGGGTGRGPVTYDAVDPPVGSVLVTTTLTPGLGPLLSRLEGIVAETGSVLSHLAILARESGVATVVGYAGAARDLAEGAVVSVDGDTGRVTIESDTDPGTGTGTGSDPGTDGDADGAGDGNGRTAP